MGDEFVCSSLVPDLDHARLKEHQTWVSRLSSARPPHAQLLFVLRDRVVNVWISKLSKSVGWLSDVVWQPIITDLRAGIQVTGCKSVLRVNEYYSWLIFSLLLSHSHSVRIMKWRRVTLTSRQKLANWKLKLSHIRCCNKLVIALRLLFYILYHSSNSSKLCSMDESSRRRRL